MLRPRRLLVAALPITLVFGVIQLYPPVPLTNPVATGPLDAPRAVLDVLRDSCFDCHSHETRWPWYASIAPISWLIVSDVSSARSQLNFSTWTERDAMARAYDLGEIIRRVEDGSMPPGRYLWLHPRARVTPREEETLREWARR